MTSVADVSIVLRTAQQRFRQEIAELQFNGWRLFVDAESSQLELVNGRGAENRFAEEDEVELSLLLGNALEVGFAVGVVSLVGPGVVRVDLPLEGLTFVRVAQSLLDESSPISVEELNSEAELAAWARACVKLCPAFTPWFPWRPDMERRQYDSSVAARPYPESVKATVSNRHLSSYERLFPSIGEQLFGPGGYCGQDFHGCQEVMEAYLFHGGRMHLQVEVDREELSDEEIWLLEQLYELIERVGLG